MLILHMLNCQKELMDSCSLTKEYKIYILIKIYRIISAKKTLLHELAHIELNQLNQYTESIAFKRDKYEDEADQYLEFLKNSIVKNK